jgi:RES domain-containing protein
MVRWLRAFRVISTRYPPIQLFERVADPADWEAIAEIESLTNPRLRDELGDALQVPAHERIAGANASYVMAPFAHRWPSRFSPGTFGVYYCARTQLTAVRETAYHMGRFYAASAEAALDFQMRVLVGGVANKFCDLRGGSRRFRVLLDPVDYRASQAFGSRLLAAGSNGIVYPSVRHHGGECLAALRPRAVKVPTLGPVLTYHFDGTNVDRWFDPVTEVWHDIVGDPARSRRRSR